MSANIPLPALLAVVVVAILVVIFFAWRSRNLQRRLRQAQDELRSRAGEYEALAARHQQLERTQEEFVREHEARMEEGAQDARDRAADTLRRTVVSLVRTLQGASDEQAHSIATYQTKFGHEGDHLRAWLDVDHENARFGRLAQALEVLSGGTLRGRSEPASIYDVAQSAAGRIKHFERVEIRMTCTDVAVVAPAVEPVALAIAELLENAAEYSAPTTPVEIEIRDVPNGICVSVYDQGLGMTEEQRQNATSLLSRSHDITDLGNPPQIGFRLIGALASRQSGFSVSLKSSPYGGVEAVLLLQRTILTEVPKRPATELPEETTVPSSHDSPDRETPPAAELPEDNVIGFTKNNLPRRRRREPAAAAAATEAQETPVLPNPAAARNLGGLQRGTAAGRATPIGERQEDR
ncbi:ATP-binding protein [Streptomyces sp. NPDC047002]|uniref:ATP-binding protein n=1 Tax=Streptomyces sp. NPDC047002 TaxID=3155475 RepID=UPI003452D812